MPIVLPIIILSATVLAVYSHRHVRIRIALVGALTSGLAISVITSFSSRTSPAAVDIDGLCSNLQFDLRIMTNDNFAEPVFLDMWRMRRAYMRSAMRACVPEAHRTCDVFFTDDDSAYSSTGIRELSAALKEQRGCRSP